MVFVKDGRPPQRTRREISAGFIVYRKTREGLKFLLLYHGHNYWNFAKGKIESEERSLEAAFRETREETGLGRRDLRMINNFKANERFSFRRSGQPVNKIVIFYLAETANPNIKISSEHEGYGWFLMRDAKRILGSYRDSQKVLKQAYDFLERRRNAERGKNMNQAKQSSPKTPIHEEQETSEAETR